MPLLATLQVGALNPLNWLFAQLSPGQAALWMLLACFQLAFSGTYLYARSLCLNRTAALVMGLIFAFGGFMIAHIEHTVIIAAVVWLPKACRDRSFEINLTFHCLPLVHHTTSEFKSALQLAHGPTSPKTRHIG